MKGLNMGQSWWASLRSSGLRWLAVALGLIWVFSLPALPALATVRQLEEAPGQVVYQSRQRLSDQQGTLWQVIAFRRVRPDGSTTLNLRLVGFPGKAEIDRSQPLTLTSALGQVWTAAEASQDLFSDAAPSPHIGQYDLQPLIDQLRPEVPMRLSLPTAAGPILLPLPAALVQEWRAIATP